MINHEFETFYKDFERWLRANCCPRPIRVPGERGQLGDQSGILRRSLNKLTVHHMLIFRQQKPSKILFKTLCISHFVQVFCSREPEQKTVEQTVDQMTKLLKLVFHEQTTKLP